MTAPFPNRREGRRSAAFRLLCQCLSRPRGEAPAVQVPAGFDWNGFVDSATDQLVAPLVARRLEMTGMDDIVPDVVRRYFRAMHRLNVTRNAHLRDRASTVASALNEIDIVPTFFKGAAALITGLYEDPGARVMSDLDMLVPTHRAEAAVKRLEALGYRREAAMVHPRAYSVAKLVDASGSTAVDVHRDFLAYPDQALLPVADVLRDAVPCEIDGAAVTVPSATHQVAINVGHAQLKDHNALYGRLPLRTLYEFTLLAEGHGRSVDWREIEERFASRRARRALDAHCHAARVLLQADVRPGAPPCRAARLALRYGLFMLDRPRLHLATCRALRVFVMLRQELSSADLRARLARNLVDPAWWRRNLAILRGRDPKGQ